MTTTHPRARARTAATAVLVAGTVVALGACGTGTDPASSSTTSHSPAYDQPIEGGHDPLYAKGTTTLKNYIEATSGTRTSPDLPAAASQYATQLYIQNANLQGEAIWKKIVGGPAAKMVGTGAVVAANGSLLDKNTQVDPWQMHLRVCVHGEGTFYDKAGKVIGTDNANRLATIRLVSADKGATWKVDMFDTDQAATGATSTPYDPPCPAVSATSSSPAAGHASSTSASTGAK